MPTGVGRSGRYKFDQEGAAQSLAEGPRFLLGRGLATPSDIEHTEARGRLDGAEPDEVSDHALDRGAEQCGTLGSGNHFLEVQIVDHVFDEEAAAVMGLEKDMVCVMIHCGSRGLGYQVCDDALAMLRNAPEKYGIELARPAARLRPGRQSRRPALHRRHAGGGELRLVQSPAAHAAGPRSVRRRLRPVVARIADEPHLRCLPQHRQARGAHRQRQAQEGLGASQGRDARVSAGPSGSAGDYRKIGQPVIIPGDMGRASWVLVGQPGSMERTFGTTCHGAGRAMSRTAAVKDAAGRRIDKELEARGVIARAQSRKGLAEEQPQAYKNVDDVVDVVDQAGLVEEGRADAADRRDQGVKKNRRAVAPCGTPGTRPSRAGLGQWSTRPFSFCSISGCNATSPGWLSIPASKLPTVSLLNKTLPSSSW